MGVGTFQPTEEPTTCLGSSSLDDLQGHQLDKAMPQASKSECTWVIRARLAYLWVLAHRQFAKQQPFRIQERQADWSPTMGTGKVPSPVCTCSIWAMVVCPEACQHFLIEVM